MLKCEVFLSNNSGQMPSASSGQMPSASSHQQTFCYLFSSRIIRKENKTNAKAQRKEGADYDERKKNAGR